MLTFIRSAVYAAVAACVLLFIASSMQAADVPSGPVAVFPDREPSKDDDLGPQGSGAVDNDNSNLTIDFGFYAPTPTPTPIPTPTPTPTPIPEEGETGPTPGRGTADVSGLSLSKSVSDSSVDAGQNVIYTIVIRNDGELPVYNAPLRDQLPAEFSYVAGSATLNGQAIQLSVNGDVFELIIPEIPANGSVTLSYAVNVSLNVPTGQHENVASIAGGPEDSAVVTVGGNRGGAQFGKRREAVEMWEPCVVVPAEIETPWFITDIAMYAASELYASSHPFIRWSSENGLTLDQHVFSPTGVKEFGAEIFQYSVENVSTLMSNSGLGLHLKYAPFITAGANTQGMSPEAYLEQRLQAYAQRSNLKIVPKQIYPLFIEYAEGDPRYTQVTDVNNWNTLLWDSRSFKRRLIPSAYGQALLRQTLLLQNFLASRHDRFGEQADGEFFGLDDARGFMGILAAEGTINKLWFMAEHLLQHAENDEGEAIPYFPYQIAIEPSSLSEEYADIEVVENDSRLFDQLSLLWALSEVMLLTDPISMERANEVFDRELLTPDIDFSHFRTELGIELSDMSPEAVHGLAKTLAAIVFHSLKEFHWLEDEGTFLNRVLPGQKRGKDRDAQESTEDEETETVSATYLGLSLTALERYYEALEQDIDTRKTIAELMQRVADYLLEELADAEKGGLYDEKQLVGDENQPDASKGHKSLQSQMAGIRGLLSSYTITQDERYRVKAFELYDYTIEEFWNDALEIFKDRERKGLYRYTPMDLGVVSGAMRELIYHSDDSQQALDIMKQMKSFIRQLTKHAGLQLSEVMSGSEQEFLIPADGVGTIRTARALDSPFGLAPVFGSEIALNRDAILSLNAERPTDFCEQGRTVFRSAYYVTDIGMYAASEFSMAATAASSTAPGDEATALDRNPNPELLNLAVAERTAQKAEDFSDYNLVHIHTKSTLGVDLLYGPLVKNMADARGMSPEDFLEELLRHYAELAGLEKIPESLAPIFLEFEGGVPEIEYGGDSERWFDQNKDTSLLPSALGQSLRRQVLWLQDVLAERHDADNRVSDTGAFLGRNAEEGFLGLVTAQAVANKVLFLKDTLLRPLESDSVSTPSGLYFPHRLEIDFDDEEPKAYELRDSSSSLFDQLSLLWGLSELYGLLSGEAGAPYREIFHDETLSAAQVQDIALELVTRLMENIEALHWDAASESLFEWNTFDLKEELEKAGNDETSDETRSISTEQIAMAGIALESVSRNFDTVPALRDKAASLLIAQADFLLRHLYREEDGAIYNGANLEDKIEAMKGVKTLLAHSAAVRTLLLAHRQSGNADYLRKAANTLEALDRSFWDPRLRVYKSAYGQYQYTPLNVAMTVGAFREFLALDRAIFLERFQEHFSEFFEQIVERIGLQLSEQQHFLEQVGEARSLAPVFASDITIQPVGSASDATIPQAGSVLTYIITVGDSELRCGIEDAYVEDSIPEGARFVRSTPAPESISGGVLRWRVADLGTNDDGLYEIQVVLRVNSQRELRLLGTDYRDIVEGRGSWNIKNCASLWCADPLQGEQELKRDCAEDELTVPQLGLEKSLLSLVAEPGREAEFEIVVTNLSEVTAYTITIEDENPEGFLYLKDSAHSRDVVNIELDDTQPFIWVLEDLETGESLRLTYTVQLDPGLEEGVYQTSLKVHAMDRSGYEFDTNEFLLDVAVGRDLMLKLDLSLPDEIDARQLKPGSLLPLTLSIENVGSETLINGLANITLPEAFGYISQSSRLNGVAFDEPELQNRTLSWKLGECAPGLSKTLEFFVQIPAGAEGKAVLNAVLEGQNDAGAEYRGPEQSLSLSLP